MCSNVKQNSIVIHENAPKNRKQSSPFISTDKGIVKLGKLLSKNACVQFVANATKYQMESVSVSVSVM
jgi:hypothetical protein